MIDEGKALFRGHWKIEWDRGRVAVQPLGGMIADAVLLLPDGREVQPFARGGWSEADGPAYTSLPPMIREMGGEWPCIPFGKPRPPSLPPPWKDQVAGPVDPWPHGHGANHAWSLVSRSTDALTIAIDYPETHPVRRLERTIRGMPGRAGIEIGLTVSMRAAWDFPLALHPVFRLPEEPGAMEVLIEGMRGGRTYPVAPDATARAEPDAVFAALDAVPTPDGGSIDLAHLPLAGASEELVQVAALSGRVVLRNRADGYRATLGYDAELFPTLMLWVANAGLTGYPWHGRFRALGVEPARAAFDLGREISSDPGNPWRKAGVPTSVRLGAGERRTTLYTIVIAPL